MNNISINNLISVISMYNRNIEDLELIKKAYNYASFHHEGQKRDSGEDYITHPLNVCFILAQMHADTDTLCAALLHDVLEDTNATKEDIEHEFNKDIANLVDGVTNIKDLSFAREELKAKNARKLITGATEDVRIIIIKLADRLHNMRTLAYKKNPQKQLEKAKETMALYVPFSKSIGAFDLKRELEDLSFKFIDPAEYASIEEQRQMADARYTWIAEEMGHKMEEIFLEEKIPYAIRTRVKNLYGIYKKKMQGKKIDDIEDLIALMIGVDSVNHCYQALGLVHNNGYLPVFDRVRDYISNPKSNGYQSLHTTVFANGRLIHTQIRTFDMDKIASYGITAYWDINKVNAKEEMQKIITQNSQFYDSAVILNLLMSSDTKFVDTFTSEVLSEDKVQVQTYQGKTVEVPKGSNIIDFAYISNPYEARRLKQAMVNDVVVPLTYELKTGDIVKTLLGRYDEEINPNWELYATTEYARRLIRRDKKSN